MSGQRLIVEGMDVTESARKALAALVRAGLVRIVPREDTPQARTVAESVRASMEEMLGEEQA